MIKPVYILKRTPKSMTKRDKEIADFLYHRYMGVRLKWVKK